MTSSLTFRGASLSSSPAHQGTYDAFLSLRGEDTRRNFTSHLYAALDRKGISTYIDDEQPRSGENISSVLPKAIEESWISVVVLSTNYASSSWCLEELDKILECKQTKGQIVLPVFYQVDPSDVRHRTNSFGEAFARLEKRFKDDLPKVQKWKAALSEIADLSGWHLNNNGNEAQFIDDIVKGIANLTYFKAVKQIHKHPVAIESPVQVLDASSSSSPVGIEPPVHVPDSSSSPAQVPDSSSSQSLVGIESSAQVLDSSNSPSPVGIEFPVHVPDSSSSPAQVPNSSSSQSPVGIDSPAQVPYSSSPPSPVGIESPVHVPDSSSFPAQVPNSSSSQSLVRIESPTQVPDSSSFPSPVGIESSVQVPDSSSSPAQVPNSSSSLSPIGIESLAQVPDSSSSPSLVGIESLAQVPDSSSSPAQVPDSSSSPSLVGIESPTQVPDSSSSPSPVGIESSIHVPDLSSSPAQVPDSSSSPSPVGIESPAQVPNSSSSPSPVGIQAPVQVPNLSSSPSRNGVQGSNTSISSEGVILFLIASVIGLLQLSGLFETNPVNMWISEAALVMFGLSYATMTKIDGTGWAKYSRIINSFRVLSGTLVLVSLSSIHLPHQLWWLFFVIWAVLGFIFVAHTWICSGADGRDDVEMGEMIPLIRPTISLTPAENSSDAAHS